MVAYRINLTAEDGALLVSCPLLPEVVTEGDDEAEARRHALGAIEEAIAARIHDGEDVPVEEVEDGVRLPTLSAPKVMLYVEARRAGVTRAELVRRLGWKRESVERLFRLDHASRLDQIDEAFRALGREIGISVRLAA